MLARTFLSSSIGIYPYRSRIGHRFPLNFLRFAPSDGHVGTNNDVYTLIPSLLISSLGLQCSSKMANANASNLLFSLVKMFPGNRI